MSKKIFFLFIILIFSCSSNDEENLKDFFLKNKEYYNESQKLVQKLADTKYSSDSDFSFVLQEFMVDPKISSYSKYDSSVSKLMTFLKVSSIEVHKIDDATVQQYILSNDNALVPLTTISYLYDLNQNFDGLLRNYSITGTKSQIDSAWFIVISKYN